MRRLTVPLLAVSAAVAATLAAPPAQAALCPVGYTAVGQPLDTGSRAPASGPQYGLPDARWVAIRPSGVPLVDTTGPAYSVRPAPGWVTPVGSATWISTTGATTGTPSTAPVGTTTYRTVFASSSQTEGYAFVFLTFAAADEIRWYLNGRLMAFHLPPPGDPTAISRQWTSYTITTHIRAGHNILEAGVTNHGGTEGLIVRGSAVSCVRSPR